MITYRYGPYEPGESSWNTEKLMGILSELVMKYDMELEEAIQMLINRGLPVNLFLREGGMDDLVRNFTDRITNQIEDLKNKYTLKKTLSEIEKETEALRENLSKKLKNKEDLDSRLNQAIDEASLDEIFRMKWQLSQDRKLGGVSLELDQLMQNIEDYNAILAGSKKYKFTGKEKLDREDALSLLVRLDELEKLKEMLENALKNGDLFNFNLESLAKYLGPESYQEFVERRKEIFSKLTELLKNQGKIVQNDETGKHEFSPDSMRRIGRKALEEIFSRMKADSSGGNHSSDETGDSENLSAKTKPLEFGDQISNMDISASIVNALRRTGKSKPSFSDIEIFEGRGAAKSSTVVLLDLSGSMQRSDRFFNAKKVVLALDSLMRQDYRDDPLMIVGFGTLAKVYRPPELLTLKPFPVTLFNPHIRLRIDMKTVADKDRDMIPLYFTNLQKGLQLSRTLLGSGETKNKTIILITDGVPTAHFEGSVLHINYPPSPGDFDSSLREVRKCTDDGITINTFLLTSDWEMNYFGEDSFIQQFAKHSMGRIFYPRPGELNQLVLVDFIANKKKVLSG